MVSSLWFPTNQSGIYIPKSTKNYTLPYTTSVHCSWINDTDAWSSSIYETPTPQPLSVYHPLGINNSAYCQLPWTPTGLSENGTCALKGQYCICGHQAYRQLPKNWTGVCYVGMICPLFFLLTDGEGNGLGVKVYDDLK